MFEIGLTDIVVIIVSWQGLVIELTLVTFESLSDKYMRPNGVFEQCLTELEFESAFRLMVETVDQRMMSWGVGKRSRLI